MYDSEIKRRRVIGKEKYKERRIVMRTK